MEGCTGLRIARTKGTEVINPIHVHDNYLEFHYIRARQKRPALMIGAITRRYAFSSLVGRQRVLWFPWWPERLEM